jgi:uncharacterized protein
VQVLGGDPLAEPVVGATGGDDVTDWRMTLLFFVLFVIAAYISARWGGGIGYIGSGGSGGFGSGGSSARGSSSGGMSGGGGSFGGGGASGGW